MFLWRHFQLYVTSFLYVKWRHSYDLRDVTFKLPEIDATIFLGLDVVVFCDLIYWAIMTSH